MEEHLYFYGLLKGSSPKVIDTEVQRMITDIGLPHKRTTLAQDLSGNLEAIFPYFFMFSYDATKLKMHVLNRI